METSIIDIAKQLEKNIMFYYLACNLKDQEKEVILIQRLANINSDIPISLFGLMSELCLCKPQYYWKRDVASEIEEIIENYIKIDKAKFSLAFKNSSTEFFESIRAYENISEIIIQLKDVEFEEGFKTKFLRNPLFGQICEDFLMNQYRFLKNIINEFSDKDYSNSNTLGAIIPILSKHGFEKCTNINTDLRNAVNHGNVFVKGNTVEYRYGKNPKEYNYSNINIWNYDSLINESYDIGCGILVGIFKCLIKYQEVIQEHYIYSEENAREWFRLTFRNSRINILYLNSVTSNNGKQLNINIKTTLEDKNSLVFSLIELARGAFLRFPQYDNYLVGFEHDRSSPGFIRLTYEQLLSSDNIGELYKIILESNNISMMPILDRSINENAFKFHIFPKITSEDFEIESIKDCSIIDYKRIKANVILSKKFRKKDLRIIINKVISELSKLETPQNPYDDVKYGKDMCDMVFVNLFTHSYDRAKFNLYPSNSSFVCSAHYYKNSDCPILKNGGVMDSLWSSYKKEKMKDIQIAWNPKL